MCDPQLGKLTLTAADNAIMIVKLCVIVLVLANICSCQDDDDFPLIDEIDLNKYTGLWYQVSECTDV